jgi:hypothetical protein
MKYTFSVILTASMLLAYGCSNSTTDPGQSTPVHKTPFTFHKPRLGATFTITSSGPIDTTFTYTVTDTTASIGGKSGALKFEGYYSNPFYINYYDNGDIDIAGSFDYVFGRNSWTSFPLSLDLGNKMEVYSHDSIISNPNPNDTRQVQRDTFFVTGKETLTIGGKPIDCITATRVLFYQLTSIKYGFPTSSSLIVYYWYAPSLGYWAKEQTTYGGTTTFIMIDFTL